MIFLQSHQVFCLISRYFGPSPVFLFVCFLGGSGGLHIYSSKMKHTKNMHQHFQSEVTEKRETNILANMCFEKYFKGDVFLLNPISIFWDNNFPAGSGREVLALHINQSWRKWHNFHVQRPLLKFKIHDQGDVCLTGSEEKKKERRNTISPVTHNSKNSHAVYRVYMKEPRCFFEILLGKISV